MNFELNRQDLFVKTLMADEGPSLKRVKAGARGRYKPRVKRFTHLTLVLSSVTRHNKWVEKSTQ